MIIGGSASPAAQSPEYAVPDTYERPQRIEPPEGTGLPETPLTGELELDTEPIYVLDLSGNMPELPRLELPDYAMPASRAKLPDSGRAVEVERNIPETEGGGPIEPKAPCHTCESRRYVDKSDDSGVSYQVPTKLSSSTAAVRVAAHEREHVYNERADAQREGAEILHQSVSLKYGCCPECGDMFVAGGLTRTVTSKEAETAYSKSNNDAGQAGMFSMSM